MKKLNEQASKIMSALLATKQTVIDNSGGTFMPVHIEVVNKVGNFEVISLIHYGLQNGNMMKDPEMIILHDKFSGEFFPSNYENDYAGIKSNSATIEDGQLVILNEQIQADHTEFANGWLLNIADQQDIEP